MALDVGELVARLTLDDSRFIQGTQRSEQQSRQATQRISNGFQDITRAAQRAGQTAQAVEINRQLEQQARDAARRISELEQNARRADQSVDDIVMNNQLLTDARRAADEIDQIRTAARQAAGAVDDIDLGNRLQQQLRDAQDELDRLYQQAGQGGGPAGSQGGGNFLSGFADAVGNLGSKTGPIGASLLGVAAIGLTAGAALAAAIKDGMEAELQRDLFQAQTGVTTAQARKFAQAAGEAYANVFGESVEANLDTARLAMQNGLLDPAATQRDAEQVIQSLDGVATILGEEIPGVARAAGNAVKSGFATDVTDAFDLLVKGAQMGLNASEDLVDTVTEYSIQFEKVGLSGAQAFGLMNQAVQAGARDTDTAADAIKEFAIRAIDGSTGAAEAYEALGFNAEEMSAKIALGGEEGAEGLTELLTKIRETEDPLVRNAAAVGLFGTKAEDLGNAMNELDLTTAVASMNDYEGAAKRAIDIMGGNAATSVEGAMRAIEMGADGLKAALAEAFGPYIQKFADNISNNRAGAIGFFIDMGNAAFEGGEQVLGFVSGGLRGLAEFSEAGSEMSVSFLRSLADMVDGLSFMSNIPFLGDLIPDLGDAGDKINRLADAAESGGQSVADGLRTGADFIDNKLIPGLGTAQDRFNEFAGGMQLSAAFNDEIQKVNNAIGQFGINADGSTAKIENWTGALDRANPAQAQMHEQLSGLATAFLEQNRTGLEAGATVEELTGQYAANRDQLIQQAIQMGLTNKEAVALVDQYGLVPDLVDTQIRQPGMPEAKYELDVLKGKVLDVPDEKSIHTEALTEDAVGRLEALGLKVETLPDGTVMITADTDDGQTAIDNFHARNNGRAVQMYVELQQRRVGYWESQGYSAQEAPRIQGPVPVAANGGVRERANGALDDLADPIIKPGIGNGSLHRTPLGPVRAFEGETGWEAYIPGAQSKRKRSEQILREVAKRFGFGLIKFDDIIAAEAQKVFKGDPKSLDAKSDPTGWRALLGGDYSGRSARFGIQEDSPIVDALLGVRKAIADGDYDGSLAKYGIQEDNPITDLLLGVNKRLFPAMADGGIVEGMTGVAGSQFPALTITDTYRPGANDHHGAGKAIDMSNGYANTDEMLAAANYIADNYPNSLELIYDDPRFDRQIKNGQIVGKDFYAGAGDHTNHVHWAMPEAPGAPAGMQASETPSAEGFTRDDLTADLAGTGPTAGTTGSGVVMSTDGQRVFVTNWPSTLGGDKPAEKPAEDTRQPLLTASMKVFENGGLREAGIAPDGAELVHWAEKGTGGEGYIPLAASKRPRSVAITRQIANRFGFELVPMADGGLTGFGGYQGDDRPAFDVPLTPEGWAGMSPNKRRATMASLAGLGIGGAFALASGFDADGNFTGQFDTGANSHPGLEKAFGQWADQITEKLEEIRKAAENPTPVDVQVDIDSGSRTAQIEITKRGL